MKPTESCGSKITFIFKTALLEVDFSLPAARVVRALDQIAADRGYPTILRSDNGPEFVSHLLLTWSAERNVRLHFIAPGKPAQNANIESLNARVRDEFLNEHAFLNLAVARREAALWQIHYNDVRPHGSLGYATPTEYARAHALKNQLSHLPAA